MENIVVYFLRVGGACVGGVGRKGGGGLRTMGGICDVDSIRVKASLAVV